MDEEALRQRALIHQDNLAFKRESDEQKRHQRDSHFRDLVALRHQRIDLDRQRQLAAQDRDAQRAEAARLAQDTRRYIAELETSNSQVTREQAHRLTLAEMEAEHRFFIERENIHEQGRRFAHDRDLKQLALLHEHAKETAMIALEGDIAIAKLAHEDGGRQRAHEIELIKLEALQRREDAYLKQQHDIELFHEQSAIKRAELEEEYERQQQERSERHFHEMEALKQQTFLAAATIAIQARVDVLKAEQAHLHELEAITHKTNEEIRLQDALREIRKKERADIMGATPSPNTSPVEIEKPLSKKTYTPLS